MKLIFLDIDGVLNRKSTRSPTECIIEEKQLAFLAELVRRSGARTVLISSWRLAKGDPWREPLLSVGISVSDITVRMNGNNRQLEIISYLEAHNNVESFVILDDQAERFDKLKGNRILVDSRTGLTKENIEQALKILETQDKLQRSKY